MMINFISSLLLIWPEWQSAEKGGPFLLMEGRNKLY